MLNVESDYPYLLDSLRRARRENDLETVLSLCKKLIHCPVVENLVEEGLNSFTYTFGWDDHHDVRLGLRWAISYLREMPEKHKRSKWADYFHEYGEYEIEKAKTIANLARYVVSFNQPMLPPNTCLDCEADMTLQRPKICTEYGHHWSQERQPSKLHALRLYLDALKICKGEDWIYWLSGEGYSNNSHGIKIEGTRITGPGWEINRTGYSCGNFCPPLPRVA